MAAWGYEFYLRVLKVSLKSERILFVTDTDEISFLFSYSFSKQQKVVIYCKMPVTEMLCNSDIKL